MLSRPANRGDKASFKWRLWNSWCLELRIWMSSLKQTISEQQYYHLAIFKALLEAEQCTRLIWFSKAVPMFLCFPFHYKFIFSMFCSSLSPEGCWKGSPLGVQFLCKGTMTKVTCEKNNSSSSPHTQPNCQWRGNWFRLFVSPTECLSCWNLLLVDYFNFLFHTAVVVAERI